MVLRKYERGLIYNITRIYIQTKSIRHNELYVMIFNLMIKQDIMKLFIQSKLSNCSNDSENAKFDIVHIVSMTN